MFEGDGFIGPWVDLVSTLDTVADGEEEELHSVTGVVSRCAAGAQSCAFGGESGMKNICS